MRKGGTYKIQDGKAKQTHEPDPDPIEDQAAKRREQPAPSQNRRAGTETQSSQSGE